MCLVRENRPLLLTKFWRRFGLLIVLAVYLTALSVLLGFQVGGQKSDPSLVANYCTAFLRPKSSLSTVPVMQQQQQQQQQRNDLFRGLLRALRQPDLEESRAKVASLVKAANATTSSSNLGLTTTVVYLEVFRQAVRSIPSSIPTGTDTEGFVSTTIQILPNGTKVPPAQPTTRTISVVDTIQQMMQKGMAPPTFPAFDWTQVDKYDDNYVKELLALYVLTLAGYRRCKDLERLVQEEIPTILYEHNPYVTLTEILNYQHPQQGTPLHMAARVGGRLCTQMLLATRLVDPNQRFGPSYAMYAHSILETVLQILERKYTPTADVNEQVVLARNDDAMKNPTELVDFDGVLEALLDGGAVVALSELQLAVQLTQEKHHVLERVLEIATTTQEEPLEADDLVALAPTAVVMDAKENGGMAKTIALRLTMLLSLGVHANSTISELVVPWTDKKNNRQDQTTISLLEVAIQSNCVACLSALLAADNTLLEKRGDVLDRVLCSSSLSEAMLSALDEALERQGNPVYIRPCVTTVHSGTAWIGNVADFETYIHNKQNPSKVPRLDDVAMAAWRRRQESDAARTNGNIKFPDIPVDKGAWVALAPTPYLQVVFHVDCPEDYLVGAVTGAIYGGFKAGEWNPLHPPESDMFFTGRMTYSEHDPRHVTWFTDAFLDSQEQDKASNATIILEAIKELPVPDETILTRLDSISLVGTWSSGLLEGEQEMPKQNGLMWTCQQEYRYGIVAGSQVFISIGYEAMGLSPDKISLILDAVLRAKYHYHQSQESTTPTKPPFFHRTRFSETSPNSVAQVPKKRTPGEIFEYGLEHGEKYTGLDSWFAEIPPEEGLRRFTPQHRIYHAKFINETLQEYFNCSVAKGLEEDATLLLDEFVMMFLDAKIAPKLAEVLQDNFAETIVTVDSVAKNLADLAFPKFDQMNTLDYYCHKKITNPVDIFNDRTELMQVKEGLQSFLKSRTTSLVVSVGGNGLSILDDSDFASRLIAACQYLILETLELANNVRRDSLLPSLTPGHIRWAISGDQQLNQMFGANLLKEFYYPWHHQA